MKVRPSALIIENNHVLLLRYNYSGNDVFALPGGNPDPGETLPQVIERELSEELGIETEVGEMLMVGEVLSSPVKSVKGDVLHCIFRAQIVGGIPIINPAQTTALEIVWQPIAALPHLNLYPNIGSCIASMTGGYVGKIDQPFFG
ncbi:NUDIX domain-containing protein [Runella sp.]|uniref:NUDIX domain-containing protein n=1 Tax=Runella sp. TaxID=1960881 RepID=UPI003D0EA4F8